MTFESRMMIDGKLVDGEAGTFTNINPANEEVLGEVADASKADMNRAIDAARRAFDDTDWSTNRELRKRCLCSSTTRSKANWRSCARNSSSRSAAPRAVTHGPQLDAPLEDGLKYPARLIDSFRVGDRSRRQGRVRDRRQHHAKGVARAGRRGRRDRAVELPVRGHHQQARAGAGHRQHRGAQARARTPRSTRPGSAG